MSKDELDDELQVELQAQDGEAQGAAARSPATLTAFRRGFSGVAVPVGQTSNSEPRSAYSPGPRTWLTLTYPESISRRRSGSIASAAPRLSSKLRACT